MPIDEFMYAVHDFHRDGLNELLAKIQLFVGWLMIIIWIKKKLLNSQLKSEPKREKFHHPLLFCLKIRLQDLCDREKAIIHSRIPTDLTDYLFSVEYCYYELLICKYLRCVEPWDSYGFGKGDV